MRIVRSLPELKNPTERLSGDQNGSVAPSVPVRGRSAIDWIGVNHSDATPPELIENTR